MREYLIQHKELSLQTNTLRIEVLEPKVRCMLQPMTDTSVMIRARLHWMSELLSSSWCDFGPCNGAPICAGCPVYQRHHERSIAPLHSVVCRDHNNPLAWWLLPQANNRFDRFGYVYSPSERTSALSLIVRRWAIDIDPLCLRDSTGTYHLTRRDIEI